ncbi:dimethylarginine dimethylaminohydrolase family protein [Govanella unica]|uniref:Arginine deiminase-related protein n=1 Tax=Govanella unica TaxID=2975056 RepID=A0A9X3Z7E7_9PROT|nr:arginine deiminase-related protein [Govania unica]MDA5194160.1 arginine deiminase-related protein [Govania unica]
MTRPTFMLCPPDHFDVSYVINPWMDPDDWARHQDSYRAAAAAGWRDLVQALQSAGARVITLPAAAGVPDMVFTANAAVVLNGIALLARFRHRERQGEEQHIHAFFKTLLAKGDIDRIVTPPAGLTFEGAGDAVWDAARRLMWMGHGPRTDVAMARVLETTYDVRVLPLKLVDPRFYHLDTALCVLSGGEVLYYPPAFDAASLRVITDTIPAAQRIVISDADATLIAANGVCIERTFISGGMTPALKTTLEARGYTILIPRISSFAKSGGSAYCLTLRLDRRNWIMTAEPPLIAAQ